MYRFCTLNIRGLLGFRGRLWFLRSRIFHHRLLFAYFIIGPHVPWCSPPVNLQRLKLLCSMHGILCNNRLLTRSISPTSTIATIMEYKIVDTWFWIYLIYIYLVWWKGLSDIGKIARLHPDLLDFLFVVIRWWWIFRSG